MALQRLAFAFDAGTFSVLKALLESEGIPVLDIAHGGHVAVAGVDQGYYLQVLEEDKPRAERLLRERGFEKYIVTNDA